MPWATVYPPSQSMQGATHPGGRLAGGWRWLEGGDIGGGRVAVPIGVATLATLANLTNPGGRVAAMTPGGVARRAALLRGGRPTARPRTIRRHLRPPMSPPALLALPRGPRSSGLVPCHPGPRRPCPRRWPHAPRPMPRAARRLAARIGQPRACACPGARVPARARGGGGGGVAGSGRGVDIWVPLGAKPRPTFETRTHMRILTPAGAWSRPIRTEYDS